MAIELARQRGGEIVNADASQLYRDLQLLSARPTPEEMQQVPHHLFGVVDGATACSTAMWRDLALGVIESIWAKGAVPIVAGGTGLYLRTLLDGIAEVPSIDAAVRDGVRNMSTADLAAALAVEDPALATRIKPADRQRLARALEVRRSTGVSLGIWQQDKSGGLAQRADVSPLLKITLLPDRHALYAACDQRFLGMVKAGALDEAHTLLARKLDPALPVMKAVGVPQLIACLTGQSSLDEAIASAQQATRHYAKRQYTWIRNQFSDWHRLAPGDPSAVAALIAQKLGTPAGVPAS